MDSFYLRTTRGIYFVLLFIILSTPALAVMSLVSTSPADGDVAVNTNCTITLTFNSPVDTTALYFFNYSDFVINIAMYPTDKIYSLDSISFSPDMMTVTLHNLQLEVDTKYVMIISGAKNLAGEMLDVPSVIHFTTGATLPTGSVSGKVTFPGGDPINTVVELVLYYAAGPQTVAATVIHSPDGSFTIPYVENNSYSCTANQDLNQDGLLLPESGDALGIYDADGNHLPDDFYVNGNITGIDFVITPVPMVSASIPFTYLNAALRQSGSDYQLLIAEGLDINNLGQARSWFFLYTIPNTSTFFYFYAYGEILIVKYIEPTTDVVTPIGSSWIDSDVASILAENAGGSEFRAGHPDNFVMAFLCSEDVLIEQKSPTLAIKNPIDEMKKFAKPAPKIRNHQANEHTNITPLLDTAFWVISYYDNQSYESLSIYINAETGTVLQPIPARDILNNVNDIALLTDPDAQLVQIFAPDVTIDGTTMNWIYSYISPTLGKLYEFETLGPLVLLPRITNTNKYVPSLPANWVDSDAAFAIAENKGGSDFRNRYPDTEIWATLKSQPITGNIIFSAETNQIASTNIKKPYQLQNDGFVDGNITAQDHAYWFITYWSYSISNGVMVVIDAVTGLALEPTTAQSTFEKAYEFAANWAADVVLTYIDTVLDTVNIIGRAESWSYYFYSASLDSNYLVNTFNGAIRYYGTVLGNYTNTAIPGGWMDSNDAMILAEYNGGSNFRAQFDSVRVQAYLYPTVTTTGSMTSNWCIIYTSGSNYLVLVFDAVTGEFPNTGILPEEQKLPLSQHLYQNYPNPFNPETTISYEIPRPTHVMLNIYDILGRKVAILVDEQKEAGVYKLKWDGKDYNGIPLANGIYFCELVTANQKQVRQMLMMK